jgi:hypothetical protein
VEEGRATIFQIPILPKAFYRKQQPYLFNFAQGIFIDSTVYLKHML